MPQVAKDLSHTVLAGRFTGSFIVIYEATAPLDLNRKYIIEHTTRMVKCLFSRLAHRIDVNTLVYHETTMLSMNDITRVAMKVQQPLALGHCSSKNHQQHRCVAVLLLE